MSAARKTYLQRRPPNDGRQYDVQCGRCGSTLSFEDCGECGGDGFVDDGDDYAAESTCGLCGGEGAFPACISGEQWCQGHPAPGREQVPVASPEWFPEAA